MRHRLSVLVLAAAASLAAPRAAADVVILDNGEEIQGEILREIGDRIVVKFPGGTLELERKRVREVRRESRFQYLVAEGEKLLLRGEYRQAIDTLREAERERGGSDHARRGLIAAQLGLARRLREIGRLEDAERELHALLDLSPGHEAASEELAALAATAEEVRREEERAREEIARGDLESGAFRLERIYERFPDRRPDLAPLLGETLRRGGDRLLARGALDEADERYSRALSIHPEIAGRLRSNHTRLKLLRIEPLVREGKFPAVEKEAREGLDVDPGNGAVRFYGALALEGQGKARRAAEEYLAIAAVERPSDLERAVGELRRAAEAKLMEAGEVAASAHPQASDVLAGGFREHRSAHFAVLHKNSKVAEEVAQVAEQHYSGLFEDLDCSTHLATPITIHLYPSRKEYLAASGGESWSGGSHQVARAMGALSQHRISCYQDQPQLLTAVLPHEVAHGLLAHRLNYPRGRIPLWANEGFAVHSEPRYFHRYYHRVVAEERVREGLLPLKDVLAATAYPEEKEDVDAFYGQCFSVVEYLIAEKDVQAFVALVKDLSVKDQAADGAAIDVALRRRFGIAGVNALENRWLGRLERGG
jgi:tetratricopeptide (TPR) repeat protein